MEGGGEGLAEGHAHQDHHPRHNQDAEGAEQPGARRLEGVAQPALLTALGPHEREEVVAVIGAERHAAGGEGEGDGGGEEGEEKEAGGGEEGEERAQAKEC